MIAYRAKTRINSRHFEIAHTADDPRLPWVVHYCGADYHFRDLYGCLCYLYGRRFIEKNEIERIEGEMKNG